MRRLRWLGWVSLLMLAQAAFGAETPKETTGAGAGAETESQKLARMHLSEMATFLAGSEKFSVTLRVGYDVVQEDGQKIEFGEIRELAVQRPDRLRVVQRSSDGEDEQVVFDGKRITAFNGEANVFAQAPQPGDIDATVRYFVRDLQMRLPLAPLLMKRLPQELSRRVQSIDYVELTEVLGKPAHHIAVRGQLVDFQVWIAEGKQPLPLRIVLNYRSDEGQPQFRADFSGWDLSPNFDETTFAFAPPKDAKEIMFAAQFAAVRAKGQPAGEKGKGGTP